MNDAANQAEAISHLVDGLGDGIRIANIERLIRGMRAGGFDLGQGREHLAVDDGAAIFFFQRFWRDARFLDGQCFLDLRLTDHAAKPSRFDDGSGTATEQQEIAAILAGERDGDGCGDPTRAAGDDDDIAGD